MRSALLLASLLLGSTGCSGSVISNTPELQLVGAPGVVIERVSLYQGPEIVLSESGDAVDTELPIIAGRDAMLRVFYSSQREGDTLTAQLDLGDGEVLTEEVTLVAESSDRQIDSTLNFRIPGDLISGSFDYRVSFLEMGEVDHMPSQHPDIGLETHPVEPETPFKVTLVPFRYNADGSGRLPSTSAATITGFEERFKQLYPISDIQIEVHSPVAWNGQILPNGAGWQEVILEVYRLRQIEGAANDEYYYAIFNPTSSLAQFCSRGCLLGVTLLNNNPSDVGDPLLRLALGVGFQETAADTMLHELGHAHGRSHAPCGPGVDPNSIDRSYPHAEAKIGGVAYDIVTDRLIGPSHVDVMSYCDPAWISDYNYDALYTRMDNIRPAGQSRTLSRTTPQPSTIMIVDEDGSVRLGEAELAFPRGVGEPVRTQVQTTSGLRTVEAELIRFDHLPGGLLVLPVLDQPEHDRVALPVDALR